MGEAGKLQDIICSVLANERHKKVIDLVLNEFLPGHEPVNPALMAHPVNDALKFHTEEEMIHFYLTNSGFAQSIYWKMQHDNPDSRMVGADITSDGKIIISLTMAVSTAEASFWLHRLKAFMNSNIGVVSYDILPEYTDGEDFIKRYQNIEYPVES